MFNQVLYNRDLVDNIKITYKAHITVALALLYFRVEGNS